MQSYEQWTSDVSTSWTAWWTWVLGDFTEPLSYKSPLASVGLLAGAFVAFLLWRSSSRFAGTPVSYGFGARFPWMIGSVVLSLSTTNLIFRSLLADGKWQPTFVVVASVPAAVVLLYGRGWAILVTAAVLGVVTVPPLAMLFIANLCVPTGIPNVVGIVSAMAVGGLIACAVCRVLPWMRVTEDPPPPHAAVRSTVGHGEAAWTIRRVIADFSEAQFIGSEWAGGLMIVGACVGFLIDPSFAGYGLELLPRILFAQVLASAIGVVLWRQWYRGGGWTATYVPVVSSAPTAVVAFDGSWPALILGAAIGAVLGAPVARLLAKPLPPLFHPFIANVTSMAVTTLVVYWSLTCIL
ncbi:putative integral membrane protein [Rhodococcus sp. RD6.2]|uniref:hypothetical protein n=1 Tax=Rhodococcus sp. RD6.2 TaxID=260936 RepID=UPI00063B1176|nr:hypothetical protein [Rhodococcus sp. RD6.2]CRK53719.1 putative integral membrane protein [Rhodococcus sp. RD6.2]